MHVLEVRGRKTGALYSTPVDLLEERGTRYLVAPRGYTQWVRNAEISGEVTLRRGRQAPASGTGRTRNPARRGLGHLAV